MTDHIAAVRAQAEREAFDRADTHLRESADPQPAKFRSGYRVGFVEGAVWIASRLTREKLEASLIEVDPDLSEQPNYLKALTDAILALLERGDDE